MMIFTVSTVRFFGGGFPPGHKYMKRDDFKNYAAALRDKSAKFKRLKVAVWEGLGSPADRMCIELVL